MGDPLSLTASAVGIISLGLTVANGLVNYYQSWHDYEADVTAVVDMLTGLSQVLRVIREAVETHTFNPNVISLVDGSIISCKTGVEALEKKLRKIQAVPSSAGSGQKERLDVLRDKIRLQGRRLLYPFKESTIVKLREIVSELRGNLDLALNTLHIDVSTDTLRKLDGIVDTLKTVPNDLKGVADGVAALNLDTVDQFQSKVYQWLSPPDPSSNYHAGCGKQHPGTGIWFLEGEEFKSWMVAANSFVWLHGIPGCGKTVLLSSVLKNILLDSRNQPKVAVAYFYFDFSNEHKQTHEGLLHSIVVQLSIQSGKLPEDLKEVYTRKLEGQHQPSVEELLAILRNLINSDRFYHIYILVDALDECDSREGILRFLRIIHKWKLPKLHLMVTSRTESDIEEGIIELSYSGFSHFQIRLQEHHVNSDIRAYVLDQLDTDTRLSKWAMPLKQEIEEALMSGARGMFRWVACQLDTLQKCLKPHLLRKALQSLPKTLEETYERILLSIDDAYTDDAIRILQWLVYSSRPLSIEEVAEALAIDLESGLPFDPGCRLRDPHDVLTICSSLVVTTQVEVRGDGGENRGSKEIRLAHFSVKEYLTSSRIQKGRMSRYAILEQGSHTAIAEACLVYLLQFNTQAALDSDTPQEYPLARYAARYWPQHSRQVSDDAVNNLDQYILSLLVSRSNCLTNWIRLFNPDEAHVENPSVTRTIGTLASPLYYASFCGLKRTVCQLLDSGADPNEPCGFCGSALHAAADQGHLTIARILLDHDADVNLESGYYGSALEAATSRGHVSMIQLLLERDADVNYEGGWYGNALQAALFNDSLPVIQAILTGGADVNMQGGRYANALQAAAVRSSESAIRLLIREGADPNQSGGYFGNALQAAAASGRHEVVILLVDSGADVNATGGYFGTALHAAASLGDYDTVRFLLERGADITISVRHTYGIFGTETNVGRRAIMTQSARRPSPRPDFEDILQVAAHSGSEDMVRLLLERGADVNGSSGKYGNALQAAVVNGHANVVELLLKTGADVTQRGGCYDSPLHAAILLDRDCILDMLLEHGADPDTQGGRYGNVLGTAVHEDKPYAVQRLLEKGAIVNLPRWNGRGRLFNTAAGQENDKILWMLIEAGANVNVQDSYGSTALSTAFEIAVYAGDDKRVRKLLDQCADVNEYGGYKDSALLNAAERGHEHLVLLLLEHGAKDSFHHGDSRSIINFTDNALIRAARNGHTRVVEILLEQGYDINAKPDRYGDNALSAAVEVAVREGQKGIVRLLCDGASTLEHRQEMLDQAFREAVKQGQGRLAESLREDAAQIDICDEDYQDCLICAFMPFNSHTIANVKALLKMGADVNKHGSWGSPLLEAIRNDDEELVRLLIRYGADVNGSNESNYGSLKSALQMAVDQGNADTTRLLLDNGAVIDEGKDSWTPLQTAANYGNKELVQLLLDRGANINARSRSRWHSGYALLLAARGGHEDVVTVLLDNGADINAADTINTAYDEGSFTDALDEAASHGHYRVVKLLLDRGATTPRTIWLKLVQRNYHAIIRLFLERGAIVEENPEDRGIMMVEAAMTGSTTLIRLLLNAGAALPPSETDNRATMTPSDLNRLVRHLANLGLKFKTLRDAVEYQYLSKVEDLLSSKPSPNLAWRLQIPSSEFGTSVGTIFHLAANDNSMRQVTGRRWTHDDKGNPTVGGIGLLLAHPGAEPDMKDSLGRTPLWWAAYKGHVVIVRALLQWNDGSVDPDARSRAGRGPIFWPAAKGHEEIVRMLLETGRVDVDAVDEDMKTPLSVARDNGHEIIVEMLEEYEKSQSGVGE